MGGIGNQLEVLIPLVGMMVVFSIPLIAILTSHQRKMAEMIQRGASYDRNAAEIAALRQEVDELRRLVIHQARVMEPRPASSFATETDIQQRLGP